jgi:hypothetical protein
MKDSEAFSWDYHSIEKGNVVFAVESLELAVERFDGRVCDNLVLGIGVMEHLTAKVNSDMLVRNVFHNVVLDLGCRDHEDEQPIGKGGPVIPLSSKRQRVVQLMAADGSASLSGLPDHVTAKPTQSKTKDMAYEMGAVVDFGIRIPGIAHSVNRFSNIAPKGLQCDRHGFS